MDYKHHKILAVIDSYIKKVIDNNIRIEKIYLFGSYARGDNREDSDIDFAVISADFAGDRFDDRMRIIPLRREIDRRLEPMPFRPEDFTEKDPLAAEILKNGIELPLPRD